MAQQQRWEISDEARARLGDLARQQQALQGQIEAYVMGLRDALGVAKGATLADDWSAFVVGGGEGDDPTEKVSDG